jgi:1-acyl-sn-glycerol-3-phosphate acyltransferase
MAESAPKVWARPGPYAGPVAQLTHWLCGAWLALGGWTVMGDWPDEPKAVILAAPHTSNWDGVNMLATAGYFRIKLAWMGKESLTKGPFGGLVRWTGCIPVNRSAANGVVRSMTEAFAARDQLLLAISPEGTRSLTREWKRGFYHIAISAQVPIILSVMDYGTRTIRISGVFHPTGDYEADLAQMLVHYRTATGRKKELFSTGA